MAESNNSDNRSSVPSDLQNSVHSQVTEGDHDEAAIVSGGVPVQPGSEGDAKDQNHIDSITSMIFRSQTDFLWGIICGFLNNLSKEEIGDAKDHFCDCVNTIIKTYEKKLREVKYWRDLTNEKNKEIKQLKDRVSELTRQLASKLCEKCGKTCIPIEEVSSLSLEENTNESFRLGRTQTDGPQIVDANRRNKAPQEETVRNKTNTGKSQFPFSCPYASCGLISFLGVLHIKGIFFCPTKLLFKVGANYHALVNQIPCCTEILESLRVLGYLKSIYKHPDVSKDNLTEVLQTFKSELKESGQKAGLLLYSTEKFQHSVTVYLTGEELQIRDATVGKDYITGFKDIDSLQLVVLKCDENGKAEILKDWGEECSNEICANNVRQLSKLASISSMPCHV